MSIQNAINSMLSSGERAAALFAYSPMVEEATKKKKEERQLDLEGDVEIETGKRLKEATEELKKNPKDEYWTGVGKAAEKERYLSQESQINLLRNQYMRTGDPEDLQSYLDKLQEVHGWRRDESIDTAIQKGEGASAARKIKEETGFTPEEWEALAMQDAEAQYTDRWAQLAYEQAAAYILEKRSQKANFEAHKEQLRRKSYKHTRYQGRKMGGDR